MVKSTSKKSNTLQLRVLKAREYTTTQFPSAKHTPRKYHRTTQPVSKDKGKERKGRKSSRREGATGIEKGEKRKRER